jgi:SPP1 family predicted phage head-tail adaptor
MISTSRPIAAGDLTHRLRIQTRANVDDGAGGSVVTFADVGTIWARVMTQNGREFTEQKKITPELTHLVRARYRAGVLPDMRLVWGNRVFDILGAYDPDGSQIELVMQVKEIVR